MCRGRYYESKVQQLKGENPRRWWDEVKRLSGAKTKGGDLISQINIDHFSDLSKPEQANAINAAFLEPLDQYRLQEPLTRFPLEEEPEFLIVTEERVLKVLSKLHARKASGPDNVPNWLLKEYADLLAFPITQILNASYLEQRLPSIWKMADVPPLPKKKPVLELNKDLRPVSLTPCVSKVAEEFVVEDFVKPAVLDVIGESQYGAIPKSSTSMALISMIHAWALGTDGNGTTVRTMLFDYRKAFDFIDHRILIDKLERLVMPRSILNWIIDFLSDRSQRIKLAKGCYSEWGPVPSGVPQGTKLGPWLFILFINDLDTGSPYLWKIVDDTTASEKIEKGNFSNAQGLTDQIIEWSRANRVVLNPDKCKEMRICFARDPECFDAITIDGKELEVVKNAKLLGLTISDNLTWNAHVNEIIKKASKKLYYLVQLKRARVPPSDLVLFYTSCVRSGVDYAVPVFYNALPQYLKNELVRIEKRALSIILPRTDYSSACGLLGIMPMTEHHGLLCTRLFDQIYSDPGHRLNGLLPPRNEPKYNLRNHRPFALPGLKTNRTKNTFIFSIARQCYI